MLHTLRVIFRSMAIAFAVTGLLSMQGSPLLVLMGETASVEDRGQAATLRIGIAPDYPPIIHTSAGETTGIEREFALGLAASMSLTPQFIVKDRSDLLNALEAGQVDIVMSGITVTSGNAIRVDFTQPYAVIGQMPMIQRSNAIRYYTLPSIINTTDRIGVVGKTRGDLLVQSHFPNATRSAYSDATQAANELVDGDIDLLISDSPTIWWLTSKYEAEGLVPVNLRLSTEYLSWAVRKGDQRMLVAANTYLLSIRESGELEQLLLRWLPFLKNPVQVAEPQSQ